MPPNNLGDGEGCVAVLAGLSLDYKRFFSESLLNCYVAERDIIKSVIPNAVCTTNLMGTCKTLDYFAWAEEMDVVSWDNYPSYNTPLSETAMNHDLMRGLKNKPFLLMEQAPSQQNWQPNNSLKKPGEIRAQSFQSIAHGADSVLFFQLRQSVGGCEKFHSAVISHSGRSDTRVFRELSDLGLELKKVGDKTIGAKTNAKAAIIFDWENYWALEYPVGPTRDMRYVEQIHRFYEYFYKNNIPVDMVSAKSDLSAYSLVAAPVLYMVDEDEVKRLENFVQNGVTLITGFMSGLTDKNDNIYTGGYPGLLKKLCGLWVEEFVALAPEQKNELSIGGKSGYTCNLLCDIIRPETATPIAVYASDFYSGTPAVTVNSFGKGKVYYFGTQPDKKALYLLMDGIVEKSGVNSLVNEKTELEVSCREKNGKKYYFIINFSDKPLHVSQEFYNTVNLLDESKISEKTILKKYVVLLIEI